MKKQIENKWEDILSLLETQYDISSIMINTWIRSLKIYEVKDNIVYFYVDEKLGENAVKFLHRKEFDLFLLSSIRETLNNIDIEIFIDEKKNFVKSEEKVKENLRKYDVHSPLLCGMIGEEDKVTERKVGSLKEERIGTKERTRK